MNTKRMNPRTPDDYVRPHLKTIAKTLAKERRAPNEYFFLFGKHDPGSGSLIPRSGVGTILELARTPTQRTKLERLLTRPCGPNDLLVIVTARDDVEGSIVRIPTVARGPDDVFVTPAERAAVDLYLSTHVPMLADRIDEEGGRLCDYVAILVLPNGPNVVLKRDMAREGLKVSGFGDVIDELDVANGEDELLCVYKIKGKPTSARIRLRMVADPGTDA